MSHPLQGLKSNVLPRSELEEFSKPNFFTPIDVEGFIEKLPTGAKIQGKIMADLQRLEVMRSGQPPRRPVFLPFRPYLMKDVLPFLENLAHTHFPTLPRREGLRRVGWSVFEIFQKTLVGRSLMTAWNGHLELFCQSLEIAYKTQGEGVEVHLLEMQARHAIFSFNNLYTFFDCFEIGVLEGGVRAFGESPDIWIRLDSPYKGDFLIRW